jgi:hypothetical protein
MIFVSTDILDLSLEIDDKDAYLPLDMYMYVNMKIIFCYRIVMLTFSIVLGAFKLYDVSDAESAYTA